MAVTNDELYLLFSDENALKFGMKAVTLRSAAKSSGPGAPSAVEICRYESCIEKIRNYSNKTQTDMGALFSFNPLDEQRALDLLIGEKGDNTDTPLVSITTIVIGIVIVLFLIGMTIVYFTTRSKKNKNEQQDFGYGPVSQPARVPCPVPLAVSLAVSPAV